MTRPDATHLYLAIAWWMIVIGTLLRLALLASTDYPRSVEWSRGKDAFIVAANIGLAVFLWWLTWG